jgi:cellulose synthase/poly-beta-1,6-N-acetylglucosamine synthase-like glycosyltransferase
MGVSAQGLIKEGYMTNVSKSEMPAHPTVSVVIPTLNEADRWHGRSGSAVAAVDPGDL